MKLEIKARREESDHVMVTLPVSTKRRWQETKEQAEQLGVDWAATTAGMVEEFLTEFRSQMADYNPQNSGSAPKKKPGRKPAPAPVVGSKLADLDPPSSLINGSKSNNE